MAGLRGDMDNISPVSRAPEQLGICRHYIEIWGAPNVGWCVRGSSKGAGGDCITCLVVVVPAAADYFAPVNVWGLPPGAWP